MTERLQFGGLSIIIPTYNREGVLAKALEGYLAQNSTGAIQELLVVDDGSTDGTEAMVREFSGRSAFPIRYLRQPNKGPAAARNFGIREACSNLVLFSDSDVVPKSDLVQQHIEWHRRNPHPATAILGYVTWPPDMNATPFMRWYGEHQLFWFDRLRNSIEADFQYFYTCNVSLKTEFLRACGQFDEDFKSAAFEDIDLGYRLSRKGLRLLYNRQAVGYHHQFFSFEDACRKRLGNAAATELFFQKQAGQHLSQQVHRRQSRPGYAIAERIATQIAGVLSPVRRLLNSSIPLPSTVYRLFFWASTRPKAPTARLKRLSQ